MSFEERVRPIERWNLALGVGATATSAVVAPPPFAVGVAVGAVLEAVNFRGLAAGAVRTFAGGSAGGGLWNALLALRFGMLALAILAALHGGADPRGLLLGLSVILPASVLGAWSLRPPPGAPQPAEPAPPPDDPSWDLWDPWLARWREPAEEGEDAGEGRS